MKSFPNTYRCLSSQIYRHGKYTIVPIRYEDRYKIMQWRNEQIYHLRQVEPLTIVKQDLYFDNVVAKIFDKEQPDQILFSFLKNEECIGYGGLVHINWLDKNAEISFIMNSFLENQYFALNWKTFIGLIEKVAFRNLDLHKLFTYAFDLRPHLYNVLESVGYTNEAVLSEHYLYEETFKDVYIHSKINRKLILRKATIDDTECAYQWANNAEIRRYALNRRKISKQNHVHWFSEKIKNPNCLYFMALYNNKNAGSIRFDINNDGSALISYLLDPIFHGKGLGKLLLNEGIEEAKYDKRITNVVGYVKNQNLASLHLFRSLDFSEVSQGDGLIKFQLILT